MVFSIFLRYEMSRKECQFLLAEATVVLGEKRHIPLTYLYSDHSMHPPIVEMPELIQPYLWQKHATKPWRWGP